MMTVTHLTMASGARTKPKCVFCRKLCRPRQHSLQCDFCHRWQHRTCETGISQAFYRRLVKEEVTLDNWPCYVCKLTEGLSSKVFTRLDNLATEKTREDGCFEIPKKIHETVPASSTRPTGTVPGPQQHLQDSTLKLPAQFSTHETTACDEISAFVPKYSSTPVSTKNSPTPPVMSHPSKELGLGLREPPKPTRSVFANGQHIWILQTLTPHVPDSNLVTVVASQKFQQSVFVPNQAPQTTAVLLTPMLPNVKAVQRKRPMNNL